MKKLLAFTILAAMAAPALAEVWTPWLDRDDPDGNGDYESRADFSAAQVCGNPAAIEAMIPGNPTIFRPGATLPNNVVAFSPAAGLICRTADQPNGGRCADYQVRFACGEREDLTEQFPVLLESDRQNAAYGLTARSFKTWKKVNPPRRRLGAENIPLEKSLFRLGQGYDPLNDQFRNECLDQTDPEFHVEQVPVTTPTRTEVRLLTTSEEVYRALSQSTTLGVNLGFSVDDTDIKFGLSTTSDLFKSEYFQSTRAVFALTFETVISQYHLNTQPRAIKPIIYAGVPGDPTKAPLLQPGSETHKRAFYKECGDRFLDDVGMGAKLTIMFHYDEKKFADDKKREVETNVGAAIEELLTVGFNQQRAAELVQILRAADVKYEAVNFGGPAFPKTLTDLGTLALQLEAFENGINEDNAVAITQAFREYTLPAFFQNHNHYDLFADTREHLFNARHFSAVMNEFGARCQTLKDYNDFFKAGFDATQCNAMDNLPAYIKRGRDNCSITANWQDCVHPLQINTLNGTPLLTVLQDKIKDFAPQSAHSGTFEKSVTGGIWNKKCIEDAPQTCLPQGCAINLPEGGRFGAGKGFTVEPWDYHSPANSDEQGSYSFTPTTKTSGERCVNAFVKACTRRLAGSRANYKFAVEVEGICPESKAFPID